jgi:hypothetical protein
MCVHVFTAQQQTGPSQTLGISHPGGTPSKICAASLTPPKQRKKFILGQLL